MEPTARQPIRLLYLIDSLTEGGAERSLLSMARPFVARGVRLDIGYLHERPGLHAELSAAGARLHPLAGSGGRVGWVRRTRALVDTLEPDLIHTTLFESDIVGRIVGAMAGVPVVTSLVNVAYGDEQRADPRLRPWKVQAARYVDMLTARRVARFHSITRHVAEVMSQRLRIDPEKIDVIPRGRDVARLGEPGPERRAAARAMLGLDDGTPMLLAAARHEYQKGLDVLIEALPGVLQAVPSARLFIAGRDGQLTPNLHELVSRLRLGGSVTFLGARKDVADLLCATDVCVIPSRWEGLAGIFLEAMAMEAPIVASDLPSFDEMLQESDVARTVPIGDPAALARAIISTLTERDLTLVRTKHARERFLRSFTIEPVVERMLSFYDRVLGRNEIGIGTGDITADASGIGYGNGSH